MIITVLYLPVYAAAIYYAHKHFKNRVVAHKDAQTLENESIDVSSSTWSSMKGGAGLVIMLLLCYVLTQIILLVEILSRQLVPTN
jgi:hypothetical protein